VISELIGASLLNSLPFDKLPFNRNLLEIFYKIAKNKAIVKR